MNRILKTATTMAAVALISSACTGKNEVADTSSVTKAPTAASSTEAADSVPTADPVVETPTPTPSLGTAKFGESGTFTQDNDNSFVVNVATPTKAKCQYSSLGCKPAATGDRVVTAKVTIKNTSSAPIEIGKSQFILEFADGTRMEAGDGNALEYQPDNAMEYDQTMRPGSTYTSTLTFEAPKGAFSVIMLDGSYGGDDLFMWQ